MIINEITNEIINLYLIRKKFPAPLLRKRRSTQMAKHTNKLPKLEKIYRVLLVDMSAIQ